MECMLQVFFCSVLFTELVGGDELHPKLRRSTISSESEFSIVHDSNDRCYKRGYLWSKWNNHTNSCHCIDDSLHGAVYCNPVSQEVSVLDCYCFTVETRPPGDSTVSVVGNCLPNCENFTHNGDVFYHPAPSDCASLNRQGTLCGQCMDGYAVPAYSYQLECIKCDSERENWGLYLVYAFLPLTIFIIIILVFRINVMSPKLNVFVCTVQALSIPILVRIVFAILKHSHIDKDSSIIIRLVLAFYGIWNLDFLRVDLLPEVCINAIQLHILLLDYLVAIYPMLLMAVSYVLVELHSFGFGPILALWRPFHWLFARFRCQWGIEATVMDTFVTFFFLSTTKLLSVSCDLLIFTYAYTSSGVRELRLYYDTSVVYLGREHLPFALMAITILTIFIVLPTSLLLFYQFKAYQYCVKQCGARSKLLDVFVDKFQCYYKDGSGGTRDCRWFAGFTIILKSLTYFIYTYSLEDVTYALLIIFLICAVCVVVIMEPYKEDYSIYNIAYPNMLLYLSLFILCRLSKNTASIFNVAVFPELYSILVFVLGLVPLVYIIVIILYSVTRRCWKQKEILSSLPDRLVNSSRYCDGSVVAMSRKI